MLKRKDLKGFFMMFDFPIQYDAPIFRPPSEAHSFLIQVTIGCSNNLCTYCDMYRSKKYSVRPWSEIESEIERAAQYFDRIGNHPKRIFLCDGDALGAPMEILVKTLEKLNKVFPDLDRVGIYATAENILEKTEDELKELSALKLNMAYLGLESGHDKILHMIVKGNNSEDMVEASLKIKNCGFKLSTMVMLGIGGREYSKQHVEDTVNVVNETSPNFFSFLTTVAIPNTPYYKMVSNRRISPLTSKELLGEMKDIIEGVSPRRNEILFRANHVSNMYPLGGQLPGDTASIVNTLEHWISQTPEGEYPPIPSSM